MFIFGFGHLLTRATKPLYDEDMVDRLNNCFAAYILIAAGTSIFGNTLGGSPMRCWDNPTWPSSWSEYASDYCFIEGTYFAPLNQTLPAEDGYKDLKKLSFYQWTPFILTLLGIMFTLPRSLWSFINWSASFQMRIILSEGSKAKKSGEYREFIKFCIGHIRNVLKRRRFANNKNLIKKLWSKMFASYYLTTWYILIKVLNIICVLIALVTLSTLVADDTKSYFGFGTIRALTYGENWRKTGIFPRLTVCRFEIREESVLDYTEMVSQVTQCVLLPNMYIEKIFIIVWYGLIMLLCANVINLLRFVYLIIPNNRESFLKDLMMPACDIIFPKRNQRRHQRRTKRKLKQLQNVIREGNENEIEVATKEYNKAQQKEDYAKQDALKKRSDNRRKFSEHLKRDVPVFVQHLGSDGYLTIRLLYGNAGNFIAGVMVARLFWKCAKHEENRHY